jgi:hypothetical protein
MPTMAMKSATKLIGSGQLKNMRKILARGPVQRPVHLIYVCHSP